jgi:cysteinyl-tRNA synthetase
LQFGEDKMSKSLGNLITIKEALEKYSPDAVRIFVLSSHYRSPLTYSEEALEAAERGADRLRQVASSQGGGGKVGERVDVEPYRQRFIEAMDDDFNTPQALANLFDLARDINRASDEGYAITQGQRMLLELAGLLGLTLKPWEGAPLSAEPFIQLLISTRDRLRQAEQWQLADEIRSKLGELGIALEDTPKGTIWRRKRD